MNKISLVSNLFHIIIVFVILSFGNSSYGQTETNINLDNCLKFAKENYPLAKQKGYLQAISENNIKAINATWFPQFNLVSKATYQSEVTDIELPGFPPIVSPKDNYSFGLQISQTVIDFGVNSQLKKTDRANTETEIQKNEVELYKLNDRIIQLYGNVLVTKENIKILESFLDDIKSRQGNMVNSVNNGISLQSNLDVLDGEVLKTSQKLIETKSNLKILYQTLSLLINKQVDENTVFSEISDLPEMSNNIVRPELQFFESQNKLLDEKINLINRKTLPRLSIFGEGAYGRPGYNFLNDKMRTYGIVGVNLSWNISSVYNTSFEKKNMSVSKDIVDEQNELFQLNLKTTLIQQNGEIDKIKQMIELDKSIVEKRTSISKTAANQLENGTLTSSDYLTFLNAEKQAELNQRIHEIQLGVAIKSLNVTRGIKN